MYKIYTGAGYPKEKEIPRGNYETRFFFVVAAAALWGSDALFRRGLALELPTSHVVFAEHMILVALTLPLAIKGIRSCRSFDASDWFALVFIGVGASAVATILFTHAFTYGNPTTPLLLQKLQPFFAIAGATLLLGERLGRSYFAFFFAGVAGAYLITFAEPLQVTIHSALPAVSAIGAAALWGLGTVMGRHLANMIEFKELTALRFAIGLPAAGVVVAAEGRGGELSSISGSEGLALLLLASIPGLLALLLYYHGLQRTPAAAATIGELAFPLSAVVINYLAFGEILGSTQWLGIALLSGTMAVMGIVNARGVSVGIKAIRPLHIETPPSYGTSKP